MTDYSIEYWNLVGPQRELTYSGEYLQATVSIDNDGWSNIEGKLQLPSFQGHRSRVPSSLRLAKQGKVKEQVAILRTVETSLSTPGFDWGLGCFGNAARVVETGKGETRELTPDDFHEMRAARERFDGTCVHDDDEWVHFQRLLGQRNHDKRLMSTEEAVAQLQEGGDLNDIIWPTTPIVCRCTGLQEFMVELDNLEAAREGELDGTQTVPGDRKGIWDDESVDVGSQKRFEDWIEATDDVEASANMPEGTRYYK